MHEASKLLAEANKLLRTADHLTYVTYPLVKDNKLIMTITENLAEATVKAMDAVIDYDRYFKRISYLPSDFQSKLDVFRTSCAPRYRINLNYLSLIKDLKNIQDARKTAKMEFVRKDNYILTQENFAVKTLNYQKVKDYVNLSKRFFEQVNLIFKNVQTQRS